jgi:hypothetical protein
MCAMWRVELFKREKKKEIEGNFIETVPQMAIDPSH